MAKQRDDTSPLKATHDDLRGRVCASSGRGGTGKGEGEGNDDDATRTHTLVCCCERRRVPLRPPPAARPLGVAWLACAVVCVCVGMGWDELGVVAGVGGGEAGHVMEMLACPSD